MYTFQKLLYGMRLFDAILFFLYFTYLFFLPACRMQRVSEIRAQTKLHTLYYIIDARLDKFDWYLYIYTYINIYVHSHYLYTRNLIKIEIVVLVYAVFFFFSYINMWADVWDDVYEKYKIWIIWTNEILWIPKHRINDKIQ